MGIDYNDRILDAMEVEVVEICFEEEVFWYSLKAFLFGNSWICQQVKFLPQPWNHKCLELFY